MAKYRKMQVGVFATETDLQHPAVIQTALVSKIISKNDIKDGKVNYNEEQLQDVLEHLFGFEGANYESQVFKQQHTRLTNTLVKNQLRYTGIERQDKDWVISGLCSEQVREIVEYGEPL